MKFKNPYIKRCLNILNKNNININIVSIEDIVKSVNVNGSNRNIYKHNIKINNNGKIDIINDNIDYDLLYKYLKELIDFNGLIEETYYK